MPIPKNLLSVGATKLINKAVEEMFKRAKVRFLGPQAVPKAIGIGFKHELSLPGIFISACTEEQQKPDKELLRALLGVAENYLDAAEAKAKARMVHEVASFLRDASAEGIVTDVPTVLGGKVSELWGEVTADVRKIIDTESQTAKNYGSLDSFTKISATHGVDDPVMFFIVVNDEHLCSECKRLHLLEDGVTPRVWYMSELGHDYHKKGDPNPKVQGLHPRCRCGLNLLGPGFGFDSGGRITYIGPEHNEIEHQRGSKKRKKRKDLRKSEYLEKMAQPTFDFPQLGIQAKRDTPVVGTQELKTKVPLTIEQAASPNISADRKWATQEYFIHSPIIRGAYGRTTGFTKQPRVINESIDQLLDERQITTPSLRGRMSHYLQTDEGEVRSIKLHEDLHGAFAQVEEKYGTQARDLLTSRLFNALPAKHRGALENLYLSIRSDMSTSYYYEEVMATLVNYLNSTRFRDKVHSSSNMASINRREFDQTLKQSMKLLRTLARDYVNEAWINPRPVSLPRLGKAEEDDANLVIVHNLSVDNLEHAMETLGALPAPSLAIKHKDHKFSGFGEITLVGGPELAQPSGDVQVFDADIYSPRHPTVRFETCPKALERFVDEKLTPNLLVDGKPLWPSVVIHDSLVESYAEGGPLKLVRGSHLHSRLDQALALAFLKEDMGIEVEIPYRSKVDFDFDFAEHMQDFVDTHGLVYSYSDEQQLDSYVEALSEAARKAIHQRAIDLVNSDADFEEKDIEDLVEAYDSWFNPNNGLLYFARASVLVRQLEFIGETTVDQSGLRERIQKHLDDVDPDGVGFREWIHHNIPPVRKRYIPRLTSTGRERKISYTLENVLKGMRRNLRGGEGDFYGAGFVRALGARKFRSLDEIKKHRHRIVTREDFQPLADEADTRLLDLLDRVAHPEVNRFMVSDLFGQAIASSFKRGISTRQALRDHGFGDVPPDVLQDIEKYKKWLVNLPTQYFEVKIPRGVSLAEFRGAVIPDTTPRHIVRQLERAGLKIQRYDAKRNDSDILRQDAVKRLAESQSLLLSEQPDYSFLASAEAFWGSTLMKSAKVGFKTFQNIVIPRIQAHRNLHVPDGIYGKRTGNLFGGGKPKIEMLSGKIDVSQFDHSMWNINHNYTQGLYVDQEYTDTMRSKVQDAPIVIRFPSIVLPEITHSGRCLNLGHPRVEEAGGGGGMTDVDKRHQAENILFGYKPTHTYRVRPIYGMLHLGHADPIAASNPPGRWYGDCWLQLKPQVRERATFSPYDSLDFLDPRTLSFLRLDRAFVDNPINTYDWIDRVVIAHNVQHPGSPLKAPEGFWEATLEAINTVEDPGDLWDVRTAKEEVEEDFGWRSFGGGTSGYVEAHVHGGIRLAEDVDSIHASTDLGGVEFSNLMSMGIKYRLPIFLHNEATGAIEPVYEPPDEEPG